MTAFLGVAAQACLRRQGAFRRPATIALELVGTEAAVRFCLVAPDRPLAELLARELTVWHPGAEVTLFEQDYLPRIGAYATSTLQMARAPYLPINNLSQHPESLSSLLSVLHQVGAGECALMQLLLQPMAEAEWTARHRDAARRLARSQRADSAQCGVIERRAQDVGFRAYIRLLALGPSEGAARRCLGSLLVALAPFHGPWNRLLPASPFFDRLILRAAVHQRRARFLERSAWLGASEISQLIHAPDVPAAMFPRLDVVADGLRLAPPRQLPTRGLLLGRSMIGERPIYLADEARLRHLLLLAPTGAGKTHAIVSFALQDIVAGRGCTVLTPSPEAVRRIVRRVPRERHDDLVLVRFSDPRWVFGINPLAQEGMESWRVASELVAVWERLYPQFWGPLVSDLFKHGVMALTERGGSSLLELVELLEDPARRKQLLPLISDPVVRRYWERFDDLTLGSQEIRTRSSLNKIRAPMIIPWLRRTLASRNSMSPRRVMDERRIVLGDLSGLADEGRLLGALFASQYFQAALRRADTPEEQRVPHILYADEWQTWPTTAWSKGLDLLRQFGVGLVLAGQRLDQVSDELRSAALANVGSAMVWGLRSDADAQTMAKWLATPGLEAADIKRLGRFQTYVRLLVDGAPTTAISVETLPLPPEVEDADAQELAIWEQSRKRYYRRASAVDRELARKDAADENDSQSRPRRRR